MAAAPTADAGAGAVPISSPGPAELPVDVKVDADFGIEEGEVDELERKWFTWSDDVAENKRLVIDEVEDLALPDEAWIGTSPHSKLRTRRVSAWGALVVRSCPFFYGKVVAVLVAVAALVVSPAQVYSIGIVVNSIRDEEGLDLVTLALLYSLALLVSAPMVLAFVSALPLLGRRKFLLCCGLGYCVGLMLMARTYGATSLLCSWVLMLVLGPGMLYPCAEAVLIEWWSRKRAVVQAAAQSTGALLGMVIFPAMLHASSHGGGGWRSAYTTLGLVMLLPVGVLAALVLDGGATDHNVLPDAGEPGANQEDAARAAAAEAAPSAPLANSSTSDGVQMSTPERRTSALGSTPTTQRPQRATALDTWVLKDVLTHSAFWLAQLSISTVDANVNAFLFHRQTLTQDVAQGAVHGLTLQVLVGLAATATTPLGLLIRRKEHLLLLAMLLAGSGLFIFGHFSSTLGLCSSALFLGAAFGVTNAYSTSLWQYLYGEADVHRIRQTSIAITCATSGSAILIFAISHDRTGSYVTAMNASALLAFSLALVDVLLLAKPEMLEAAVRRAPTWEQLLAWRQREGHFGLGVQGALKQVGSGVAGRMAGGGRWAGSGFSESNQANPVWEVPAAHAL